MNYFAIIQNNGRFQIIKTEQPTSLNETKAIEICAKANQYLALYGIQKAEDYLKEICYG
jgi:hypothetical protein